MSAVKSFLSNFACGFVMASLTIGFAVDIIRRDIPGATAQAVLLYVFFRTVIK